VTDGAEQAREQARDILAESRFHDRDLPRPLGGVLDWLGDRLRELVKPFDWVDDAIPGGDWVVWTLLAVAVIVVATFVAGRLARRRAAASPGPGRGAAEHGEDPRRLEREADEAERAGDLERALRLRFRAGVLRLAQREVIQDPGSVTTGQLRRRLRAPAFDPIGVAFDEVVYGRRPAREEDARAAREGWPRVLAGVDK
jgi:Domain of unknown function (DUF4129)